MYRRDSLNSELVDTVPAYPSKDGFINRVPYSSVMAFVMCIIGVLLFATMMIWSFNATIEQARRALDITNIPWLEQVHLAFIILAFLMAILSIFLLLIGVLSTGSTREEVYKRKDSRRGGRIVCAIAIVVSYLLNILWVLICCIVAILSFVYYIFSKLCVSLNDYSEHNCLDFDVFKPLVQEYSNPDLKLCGGNVQQFCALTSTVFSWNIVGLIGSLIIVLGLVQFIASNASNYAHVNNEQRYIELKEVLYMEGVGRDFIPPPQAPVRAYPSPPTVPPPRSRKARPFEYRDEPAPPRRRERSLPKNTTQGMGSVRRNSYQHSLHGSTPWLNNQY
jgi:magnesium-transporting ATPase (P-type)